jgi:hypothetical protein
MVHVVRWGIMYSNLYHGYYVMRGAHRNTVCFGMNSTCCRYLVNSYAIPYWKKVYQNKLHCTCTFSVPVYRLCHMLQTQRACISLISYATDNP